jgi:hypothetical protein
LPKKEEQAMSEDLKGLSLLPRTQIKPAAEMLGRAFKDNPGISYYFPDEHERKRILPYIFQYSIRRGLLYGEVHISSPSLEGVAVWLPSENIYMNKERITRAGGLYFMSKVGKENITKYMSFGEHISSVHNRCAPFQALVLARDRHRP